jgi:two-component system, sensor histidine kinase and response regulator
MRIQRTSQVITVAITVLSVLAIGCALWSRQFRIIQERSYETRRKMFNLTEQIAVGSDRLTGAVRAYAATGDLRHYQAFQKELNIDRNRDFAVQGLRELGLTEGEEALISRAKENSDNLVHLEKQAFAAVNEKDTARAVQIVFGPEYETAKAAIMAPIAEVRRALESRLTNHAEQLAAKARLLTNIALVLLTLNASAMVASLLLFYRRRVVNPLAHLNRNLADLAARKPEATIGYQEDNSELGEVARSMERYRVTVDEAERQHWVKSSLAEIADAIQGAQQPDDFGRRVLSALVPLVGGGYGVFYLLNDASGRYAFTSGYGVVAEGAGGAGGAGGKNRDFAAGEGISGQAALERKIIIQSAIPADYLRI